MDWLSFPGLFKYITILGVVVYACQWLRPEIGQILEFNRARVFENKEIWRVFTFIFAHKGSGFGMFGPVAGAVLLYFAVMISFMISDSLEQTWGPTRTTLYILLGIVGMAFSQLLIPHGVRGGGVLLYLSMFFAFATLFPKVEFMLFFLIPVQVRYLAALAAILLVINVLGNMGMIWMVGPAMLPYLLWVLPNVIGGQKTLVTAAQRRRKFTVAKGPESEPFHVCEVCRRTERDPGDLEFFVTPDGKEYCSEHLPKQS